MINRRHVKEYTPLKGRVIDVAGIHYKIVYFKRIEGLDIMDEEYDPDAWTAGWADLCGRKIGLFAYLTKEEHQYVLFHECMHTSMEAVKTSEDFQREDFIKPISRIMFSTLRQVGAFKYVSNTPVHRSFLPGKKQMQRKMRLLRGRRNP